jgi:hypothetical protein
MALTILAARRELALILGPLALFAFADARAFGRDRLFCSRRRHA